MIEQIVITISHTVFNVGLSFASILIPLVLLFCIQKVFIGLTISRPNIFNRITGMFAVPIHEISHMVACLIFRHKIISFKLYHPQDACLGYVEHSYNPRSPWQYIGNFFIGIAPVFGGVIATGILSMLLLPNGTSIISELLQVASISPPATEVIEFYFRLNYELIQTLLELLMLEATIAPVQLAIWVGLVSAIGLYLSPSRADMVGSLRGFLLIVLILIITDFMFGNEPFYAYLTGVCLAWSALLVVSVFMSAATLGLLLVVER